MSKIRIEGTPVHQHPTLPSVGDVMWCHPDQLPSSTVLGKFATGTKYNARELLEWVPSKKELAKMTIE